MAYVMVKDVTPEKAGEIKTRLEKVEGVATVTYVESMNYKNNSALYTVTLKDYDSTAGAFDAVKDVIDALSDEKAYLSGQSAFSYYTKLETEQSIMKLGIAIVVIILLVMLFTSKTYFELIVLILVFGAAMAINMGTNFLFVNGISYIANLVALVLQLALSLDYSIILCTAIWKKGITAKTQNRNGYRTYERAARDSVKFPYDGGGACRAYADDAVNRLGNRVVARKRYRHLYGDGHILYAGSSRDFRQTHSKTRHKSFVPNITKPARAIVKARKVIVPAFLLIAILAGVAQGFNKYSFNYNSGSLIVAPKKVIEETGFGTLNSLVVVVPKGDAEKNVNL